MITQIIKNYPTLSKPDDLDLNRFKTATQIIFFKY